MRAFIYSDCDESSSSAATIFNDAFIISFRFCLEEEEEEEEKKEKEEEEAVWEQMTILKMLLSVRMSTTLAHMQRGMWEIDNRNPCQ